jgi:hypothetical protein
VHIRTDIRPGDIGAIVRMHFEVYYTRIFLLTASDLPASAHLYGEAGFVATSHTSCTMWGAALIEERHELQLTP